MSRALIGLAPVSIGVSGSGREGRAVAVGLRPFSWPTSCAGTPPAVMRELSEPCSEMGALGVVVVAEGGGRLPHVVGRRFSRCVPVAPFGGFNDGANLVDRLARPPRS